MNQSDFSLNAPGTLIPTLHKSAAFLPARMPPNLNIDLEIKTANESALLALGTLKAIVPSLPNPALVTIPFTRREAVLSSKIEGTKTEIAGLFLFEEMRADAYDDQASDDSRDDAQQVLNYVLAQKAGLDLLQSLPIVGRRLICLMHETLMSGCGERGVEIPGQYRRTQVFIGNSDIANARYVPPPSDYVEDLMADLERYMNTPNLYPTLVNIALAHYQFEAIHPFYDGNGRLGRLMIAMQLAANKILEEPILYLSAYFERNKNEYVNRLWQISSNGEWHEWILFFLRGVHSEAEDAAQRARKILKLRENYRSRFQNNARSAARILELVDRLFRWPVIDINGAKELLDMSFTAASKHIRDLQSSGVLTEVTGYSRHRKFIASEIVDLMS